MRLIDADLLVDAINKSTMHYAEHLWKQVVCDVISNQPTAYNVDKVVEELNEQWNDVSCIDDDMYCIGVANGLAKAIDIVKRGGVE